MLEDDWRGVQLQEAIDLFEIAIFVSDGRRCINLIPVPMTILAPVFDAARKDPNAKKELGPQALRLIRGGADHPPDQKMTMSLQDAESVLVCARRGSRKGRQSGQQASYATKSWKDAVVVVTHDITGKPT